MKQLVKNNNTGELSIEDVPIPMLKKGHLLIKNHFSAVSIGTELASVDIAKKSILQKAISRPEDLKKVFNLAKKDGYFSALGTAIDRLNIPTSLGYSSSGTVLEVGEDVNNFAKGDLVACGGSGHAEVISVPKNLCVKLPKNANLERASFTTISSIALQGIHQSKASAGQYVIVVGLGLLGQITMDILRIFGSKPIGIDLDANKVKLANSRNHLAFQNNEADLISKIFNLTNGYGADCSIITASAKNNSPLDLSVKLVRDKGQVTIVGDIKIELPRKEFYAKELNLNISRSYGPGRYMLDYEEKGMDYPIAYVRWTENRNMELVSQWIEDGKIDINSLITDRIDFSDAVNSYEPVNRNKETLGVVFLYDSKTDSSNNMILKKLSYSKKSSDSIQIGLVGPGSYAQGKILPFLKADKRVNLNNIVGQDGMKSKYIGNKFGFLKAGTDFDTILSDDKIDTVFISTRHDTHAKYAIEALKRSKNVFVEKPLAINLKELEELKNTWQNSDSLLFIGYNRRYSKHTTLIRNKIHNRQSPVFINYRINAGRTVPDHWANDLEVGGGRIVGEFCHFIDLCKFITNQEIIDVTVKKVYNSKDKNYNGDTISVNLAFADGSVSSINYITFGNTGLSKERVELFFDDTTMVIDDFMYSEVFEGKSSKKYKSRSQDKGPDKMLNKFVEGFLENKEVIKFEDVYETSKITFDILNN